MGISHAVRVDRYSEVRPAAHTNQNSAAQAPITKPAPTRAGLQCRFPSEDTWIHKVAASVVAPTAISPPSGRTRARYVPT